MPRDMTGCGRYPPQPRHKPLEFYSAVRLGDAPALERIMEVDPYFVTQDNGAGAPVHFAATYKQLDMLHHLLNRGAEVNQRDHRGWTPLHRAAHLAHYDGYLEVCDYLLSRGADPRVLTKDYDRYLDPGRKTPLDVCVDDEGIRSKLRELIEAHRDVEKARVPHEDVGCWWTLYDYGLDVVKGWDRRRKHPYPEEVARRKEREERRRRRDERRGKEGKEKGDAKGKAISVSASSSSFAFPPSAAPSTSSSPFADSAFRPSPFSPRIQGTAVLFPGQGAQSVGMLSPDVASLPAVAKMLKAAREILGYDLGRLMSEGPKERLDDTAVAQPALFVAGLAAVEKARAEAAKGSPSSLAVDGASAAAGLSLGEYCALTFAGALSFEDGLRVVKARGEAMAEAARDGDARHGMLTVVGLDDAEVASAAAAGRAAASASLPDPVCDVANRLFPTGRVLSGHVVALEAAAAHATKAGAIKAAMLPVAGGFHTRLMSPAADALREALRGAELRAPRIPVYSNVTGRPFPFDESADRVRELLARQLVEPVLWQETLEALSASSESSPSPSVRFVEAGPGGGQIRSMMKRIDGGAWKKTAVVSPAE